MPARGETQQSRAIPVGHIIPLVFFCNGVTINSGPIHLYTGLIGGSAVFDSLSDRMKQDDQLEVHKLERYLRWGLVVVLSFVLFGGLYLVVQRLE